MWAVCEKITMVPCKMYYAIFLRGHITKKLSFTLRAQSAHFAHARINQHTLNQALHTLYKKLVFDTRVRK